MISKGFGTKAPKPHWKYSCHHDSILKKIFDVQRKGDQGVSPSESYEL